MAEMANWIAESVSGTPGTGTVDLGGAIDAKHIAFNDIFVTGTLVHYSIEDGNNREIGIGTLTTGTPWTLARTTVLETLDSGAYDNTSPAAISLTASAIVSINSLADMPGAIVGSAITIDASYQSTDLVIPYDNTIPQNTEGYDFMTVSYTPKYADSLLLVSVKIAALRMASSDFFTCAIFRDSIADAIASTLCFGAGGGAYMIPVSIHHEELSSSVSATTFKVRVGLDAGTVYLNGDATAALDGGVLNTYIKVEEIRQ